MSGDLLELEPLCYRPDSRAAELVAGPTNWIDVERPAVIAVVVLQRWLPTVSAGVLPTLEAGQQAFLDCRIDQRMAAALPPLLSVERPEIGGVGATLSVCRSEPHPLVLVRLAGRAAPGAVASRAPIREVLAPVLLAFHGGTSRAVPLVSGAVAVALFRLSASPAQLPDIGLHVRRLVGGATQKAPGAMLSPATAALWAGTYRHPTATQLMASHQRTWRDRHQSSQGHLSASV